MGLMISLRDGLFMVLVLVLFCFSNTWGTFGDEHTEKMDRNELFHLHFYRHSCPSAELIVKQEMKKSMMSDPTTAAALLRLAFHDCQVNGCDGSVLVRDGDSNSVLSNSSRSGDDEIDSQKNFGIKKLDLIDGIKSSIEKVCPQTVSCADIIQLAAREAIYLSGGPYIEILTGRRDGVSVSNSKKRADKQLPSADISVDELIEIFRLKNISLEDGVALMGAHTLGVGHCRNFENRLQPAKDPTMSPIFYIMLRVVCRFQSLSNVAFAPNDATLFSFDNQYFVDIQNGRGLLKIDSEISRDPRTLPYVVSFGRDRRRFFEHFSNGFLKLSAYRILLGEEGEIRRDCRFSNS